MRKIGIHLRLTKTFLDLVERAAALNIPIFQCFFINQETNQFISLSDQEIAQFLGAWRNNFQNLYLHGSYWINLASNSCSDRLIRREIELARRLAFTHIILHPGSARKARNKEEGISLIARNLNRLLKTEHDIKIVLENTAHAGLSIGGDLHDFLILRRKLDAPEKVQFCIDTAHAFSYGYDIRSDKGQEDFIKQIQSCMGMDNIALIHLNDTLQPCGSRIDRHEKIGGGSLKDALKKFILTHGFNEIPLIMELPVLTSLEEQEMLTLVKSWCATSLLKNL